MKTVNNNVEMACYKLELLMILFLLRFNVKLFKVIKNCVCEIFISYKETFFK